MEELSGEQLESLKEDLVALEGQLLELLEVSKEGTKPVELDQPIGRLSRMDAMQHQQMATANRQSHQLRLKQVKRALGALTRDEYGECGRCEEPIGFGRLKARPETPFCLGCQGLAERR